MSKIYLIGDLHLFHRNIIKYCDRPFEDVPKMNAQLVANWNKAVRADDKVIVVGDFALAGKEQIISVGNQLNGRKTLILGNHDGASLKTYFEAGFEIVSPYPIVLEEFFIISHYPQFVENQGLFANIYAHVHNMAEYKDYTARTFCVSAERINYTPIDFEEIKAKMESVDFGR